MHARTAAAVIPGHEVVLGAAQPTAQSLRLDADVVTEGYYDFEVHPARTWSATADPPADPPVRRRHRAVPSATLAGPLPQQHGSLAKTPEAIGIIRTAILGRHLGGRLGEGDIGIPTPTWCGQARRWAVLVDGVEPYATTCTIHDAPPTCPSTPRTRCMSATVSCRPP